MLINFELKNTLLLQSLEDFIIINIVMWRCFLSLFLEKVNVMSEVNTFRA